MPMFLQEIEPANFHILTQCLTQRSHHVHPEMSRESTFFISYYEGWNFNSGNYLFTTDTK